MESGKCVDAWGCLPGHDLEQADAEQAYVQARLTGTPTWVLLPEDQWPQEWKDAGYRRPVIRLTRALYGHPDSGTMWESHCNTSLKKVGFMKFQDGSRCFFTQNWT